MIVACRCREWRMQTVKYVDDAITWKILKNFIVLSVWKLRVSRDGHMCFNIQYTMVNIKVIAWWKNKVFYFFVLKYSLYSWLYHLSFRINIFSNAGLGEITTGKSLHIIRSPRASIGSPNTVIISFRWISRVFR